MPMRRRAGFTLVELLVVITIIGMLMAMLLPAVNSVRENGRRTTCLNNQKNVAAALLTYESNQGYFPGWRNLVGPGVSTVPADRTRTLRVGWAVMILPYLEHKDIFDSWNLGPAVFTATDQRYWPNKYLKIFVCPSDPPDRSGPNDTPTAYALNCGLFTMNDNSSSQPSIFGQQGTTSWRPGAPQAYGIIGDMGRFRTVNINGTNVEKGVDKREANSIEYITSHDGTSRTILVGENVNIDANEPANIPIAWARCDTYPSESYLRIKYMGFFWHKTATARNNKINDELPIVNTVTNDRARLSSFHGNMVVVTFADQHGQTLRQDIDAMVYYHLMTPYGADARVTNASGYNLTNGLIGTLSDADFAN